MRRDPTSDQLGLDRLQLPQGAFLVRPYETGIRNHIRGEDRRQSPLDPLTLRGDHLSPQLGIGCSPTLGSEHHASGNQAPGAL
jgi:hypothetical protein